MAKFQFKPGAGFYFIQRPDGLFFTRDQTWTDERTQAFRFIGNSDPKIGSRDALAIIRSLGLKRSALVVAN